MLHNDETFTMDPRLVNVLRSENNPTGLTMYDLVSAIRDELDTKAKGMIAWKEEREANRHPFDFEFDEYREHDLIVGQSITAVEKLDEVLTALKPAERLRIAFRGPNGLDL